MRRLILSLSWQRRQTSWQRIGRHTLTPDDSVAENDKLDLATVGSAAARQARPIPAVAQLQWPTKKSWPTTVRQRRSQARRSNIERLEAISWSAWFQHAGSLAIFHRVSIPMKARSGSRPCCCWRIHPVVFSSSIQGVGQMPNE